MGKIRNLLTGRPARNASWLIGAKIYQVLINLVVSMLMARYLGPSNFGLINYAASFATLFNALCTLGIDSILVNELLGNREHGKLLGSGIGLRLCSSGLSVVTIVLMAHLLNPNEPTTVAVVLLYSISLIFRSFDLLNLWYQANLESKMTAIINAVGYTVAALYKVWLLIARKDVKWFAAAHAVEFAFVALLLLVSYSRRTGPAQRLTFSRATGTHLVKNSYHFILSGMMVAIYGQMDRVMLKAMLDETAVGYYSTAVNISSMWAFVLMAVIDAWKPAILAQYHRDREKFDRSLIQLYGAIIYISIAAGVCIFLLSKYLILILYGSAYLPARSAVCIVCWYTAFSYLGVARSIWLVPQGKQKYVKWISASGAACNMLLNTLMIPVWGIDGAAVATLLTQIFTNFIVGFFFREIRENNILILKAFCFWRYLK